MLGSSIQIAKGNTLGDDTKLSFGPAALLWETADANANALFLVFPEGGATDVPVFVIGDASIDNQDLTWFNGITEPTLVLVNDAKDAYVSIDAGDDAVAGSKGVYFKAAADEDIELLNLSVTGTPRIYWDESEDQFRSTKGWVFDALCDVQGVWVATATWTLPAFTAGGDISMAGYYLIPASGGNLLTKTSGSNRGLLIESTYNGGADVGPQYTLQYNRGGAGAVANLDTDFFIMSCQGYNDNATPENVRFAHMRVIIDDASDTTEDAHWEWYAYAAGAENEAMDLTGAGLLWLDVGVNVDDYYQVAGTQVVAAQGAAVADVSDGLLATTITQLNALLARVRTHGLIAT